MKLCGLMVLMLAGCALASCTAQPPPPQQPSSDQRLQQMVDQMKAQQDAQLAKYDQALQSWQPQLRKYMGCNNAAAAAIASQEGDPVSLAIAARGMCMQTETDLQKAVNTAYADLDPEVRNHAMETARKTALEHNAAVIATVRAKKAVQ